jgi:lysozyme family protein
MAASSYADALAGVLKHEGGYSDHPSDPGGPTNFGITLADVRRYVKPNATAQDVRALSLAQAKGIYRTRYWDVLRCDELPRGVDYAVFDYGVNSGPARAAKVLCAMAERPASSVIDDATLSAIRAQDAGAVIVALCDERLAFLKRLKTWPVFGVGWSRRVADVKSAALAMAAGGVAPAKSQGPEVQQAGKAVVPVNKAAQRTAAGGAVAGGAAAAQQAHHAGAAPMVVVMILAGAVLLAIGAWLFWRWRQKRRQQAPITSALNVSTGRQS